MSDIHLISGYRGNSVTGLTGSSVNFSWSFSNGTKGVRGVLFGLIKDHRALDFIPKGILVAFGESGNPAYVPVPVEYNGRVGGSYDGNKSTGHAIFTLSSIKKDDERFFGCRVSPQNDFDTEVFDSVYLNVAGGLYRWHIIVSLRKQKTFRKNLQSYVSTTWLWNSRRYFLHAVVQDVSTRMMIYIKQKRTWTSVIITTLSCCFYSNFLRKRDSRMAFHCSKRS